MTGGLAEGSMALYAHFSRMRLFLFLDVLGPRLSSSATACRNLARFTGEPKTPGEPKKK